MLEVKPLHFITRFQPNQGFSTLVINIMSNRFRTLILPVLCLIFVILGFLYFSYRMLQTVVNGKGIFAHRIQVIIWLCSLFTVLVAVLLITAGFSTLDQNPLMGSLGFIGDRSYIYYLAVIQCVLVLSNMAFIPQIWQSEIRIPGIITVVGGVGVSIFVWINHFV